MIDTLSTSSFRPVQGQRIGLLGGSFNPAHEGHVHISRLALDHLGLDEIWWLVSPQNPLKAQTGMAPFETRLESAQTIVRGAGEPRIRVSGLERDLGTEHTVDTLAALKDRYPAARFVWIIGADNLIGISDWKDWQAIFDMVPIAVFPRPSYSLKALESRAAQTYVEARLTGSAMKEACTNGRLANMKPPVWVYLDVPTHDASATRIREGQGG